MKRLKMVGAAFALLVALAQPRPALAWDHVFENFDVTSTVKLDSPAFNNTLIRNCKIHDVDGDGIYLSNVTNVRIENCEIYDVTESGIRLGISASTHDVTLLNNQIHDVGENGVQAGQRYDIGVNHYNLQVLGNYIDNTGLTLRGGLTHGMYIQAQDFLIEGNTVMNSQDGNGISVRSSGVIRGNTIGYAAKSAITYYADHMRGPSDTLTIENNIGYGNASRATVELLSVPDIGNLVHNFVIRFNTAVSFTSAERALQVHADYSGQSAEAYGNILINTQSSSMISSGPFTVFSQNYQTTSLAGFQSSAAPYNFHLTSSHGAIDYVSGSTSHPSDDLDGDSRPAGSGLDAGADEYSTYAARLLRAARHSR